MLRQIMAAACGAAIALAIAAGSAGAHEASFRTGSSFGYFGGSPDAFLGQVSSRHAACERNRLVKVYRAGRRNRLVGRDRTSSTGQWAIERERIPRARYYAVVAKRTLTPGRHRHVCRAYRSSTLRLGG